MGYREKEVARMTPKKVLTLFRDYQEFKKPKPIKSNIDDVIPF